MQRQVSLALALVLLAAPLAGCMEAISDLQDRFGTDRAPPGERAEEYIRGDEYANLVIEIDHPPGSGPHTQALDRLESAARDHLDKGSVTIRTSGEVPTRGDDYSYSLEQIAELEREHRDQRSSGDTAHLYVLYVDGGSDRDDGDRKVLGTAYRGSSFVMFKGNIRETSCTDCGIASTKPDIKFVERAVIVHELGHILGLVDSGIPAQNQDRVYDGDGCHCHSDRRESVMYYAVESSRINNVFDGGRSIPHEFDQYDEQDIRNVREGG